MKFSPLTQKMTAIAKKSGALLKKGFHTHYKVISKPGSHNLVTEYDLRSEKMIRDTLKKEYPDCFFVGEEEGGLLKTSKDQLIFIIDPLDGTVNFAHGVPQFAVSIAAYQNGSPLSGVVYHPILDELFVAEHKKGAYLNGKKLQVSKVAKLKESLLVTGFPYHVAQNPCGCIEAFARFIQKGIAVRRLGSAALDMAYVAAGRFEAFWETGLGPWDCAAGIILVEEAGGKVTNWDGTAYKLTDGRNTLITSNGKIHKEMVDVIHKGA